MSDSKRDNKCPGCAGKTATEELLAFGMVISAARALLDNRLDDIKYMSENMTPFEAHKAVTLFCMMLLDLSRLTGLSPEAYLERFQEGINAQLAAQ